jgi:dephospho-CoA kinase
MMQKVIGITGGIGAGKTTIAKLVECLGYSVFYADKEAKKVYQDIGFRNRLVERWGVRILKNDLIDFKTIGNIVFSEAKELAWLNAQIHPLVAELFQKWCLKQASSIVFKEAAILFESGAWKECNAVITVESKIETRIQRVMQRDGVTKEQVMQRINRQLDSATRIAKSDFVIHNDGEKLVPQIKSILEKIQNNDF